MDEGHGAAFPVKTIHFQLICDYRPRPQRRVGSLRCRCHPQCFLTSAIFSSLIQPLQRCDSSKMLLVRLPTIYLTPINQQKAEDNNMTHLDGEEDTWPPSSSSSLDLQPLKISEKTPDLESQHSRRQRFKVDPRMVSDAIIGLSDGLTVPFALTAGLSALGSTKIVVYGGLAELIAGAISMGLGGYLGAKSELYVLLSLPNPNPASHPPGVHSCFHST